MEGADVDDPRQPLLGSTTALAKEAEQEQQALSEQHASSPAPAVSSPDDAEAGEEIMENLSRKSQWIVLALASGGCAAFNGVFAKLQVAYFLHVPRIPSIQCLPFLTEVRIYF